MTGQDHDTDALIAALRSPALPAEQVGEAEAVAAMLGAFPTGLPVRRSGLRSRRGAAIAAVTVASLGVGGLVAAGPSFFTPAADRPVEGPAVTPTTGSDDPDGADDAVEADVDTDAVADVDTSPSDDTDTSPAGPTGSDGVDEDAAAVELPETGDDPECAAGAHGDAVSAVATSTVVDGNHGEAVREVARANCGSDGERGKSADAPGQTGDTPGQTGDTPGRSGDTPGQSGDTPGRSGDTPGRSGETPGGSHQPADDPGTPGTPGASGGSSGSTGQAPPVESGGSSAKGGPSTTGGGKPNG